MSATRDNNVQPNKRQILLDSYNNNLEEINKNAQLQRNASAVSYQKLLKYLPEYNSAMGITGGASESALLQANSDHSARLATIESNTASQKNAAKSQYNQDLLDLYDQEQAEIKTEQTENYNLALDTINNWNGSSADLDAYINGLKGKVSDEQYNSLRNAYINANEVVVEDEKAEATYVGESRAVSGLKDDHEEGENFDVYLDGKIYKVESGGEYKGSDSATILRAAVDAGVGDKEVFYYGGKVYLKVGDSLYNVRDRIFKGSENGLVGLTDYLKIDSKEKKNS